MSKPNRKPRNIVELLATRNGQLFMNTAYSLGAAVVILGALFKILGLPGGSTMLMLGMVTEVIIFTLSAFDRTGDQNVEWERVFPVLKTGNQEDNPLHTIAEKGVKIDGPVNTTTKVDFQVPSIAPNFTSEQSEYLTQSLNRLNESAKQLSRMADLADATQDYLKKLNETTSNLDRFSRATNDLASSSSSLASSYTTIADSAYQMKMSTGTYVEQMNSLNGSIEGLSRVYTEQLQGITNQVRAISQVHADLNRLQYLFEGSSHEAERFKRETERMAEQLTQLNVIYSRMINAMTASNQRP